MVWLKEETRQQMESLAKMVTCIHEHGRTTNI